MAMAMECISLQACGLLGLESEKYQCMRVWPRRKGMGTVPAVRGMSIENSVQNLQRVQVQRADRLVHNLRLASATPLPLLRQVADALVEEMCAGLASEGGSEQLKMLPSYVENLPSGCVQSNHLSFHLSILFLLFFSNFVML